MIKQEFLALELMMKIISTGNWLKYRQNGDDRVPSSFEAPLLVDGDVLSV